MDRRSFLKKLMGGGGAVMLSRFPGLKPPEPAEKEVNEQIAEKLHSVQWAYSSSANSRPHHFPTGG